MKDSNACVTQWYLALQFFWVWVGHRPKKEREKVDFFSRTDEEIWLLGECTNWSLTVGRYVKQRTPLLAVSLEATNRTDGVQIRRLPALC